MKKISCVIMDWAGTAVDFGCFAPLNAFLKVFSEEKGIDITYRQAREPMGLLKIDHIKAILNMPEVKAKFQVRYNRDWNMDDVNEMYRSFEKHLFSSLRNFTDPIPGVLDTMKLLREEGIRIGSTTGYTQAMMEVVRPDAAAKGYVVDNLVTPDDVPAGRPAPYMIYKNMIDLAIPSVDNVVKVGDTIADIKEGVNAKVWSVGIVTGSNEMGLTEEDISDLFGVLPREDSFYHEIEPQSIEYNGTFVCEGSLLDVSPESSNTRSYNGNLPSSDVTQKERIENIYGIALQYYRTNYYEGSKVDGTAFGNYLSYLYLSHYIDGPGRAPTANDLPYIISTSDVSAYNQFLSSANLSNWANNLANLGSALYSDFDYMASLTSINSVDQLLSNGVNQVTMEAVNGYNTTKALITIAPLIKKYIVENHATAVDDVTLTDDTLENVESQLSALNFYETFDKDITSAVISIVTTTFISAICSSISLMGVFVSVVPLFVYECTGLIQTAVLARLQYSFSGRYAVRTGIYIDNM